MNKREKTLASLQALARDPNVNENVAMEAIKKLQEYSERWGINLDDLANKSDTTSASHYNKSEWQYSFKDRGMAMVDKFCSRKIAEFHACKVWRDRNNFGDTGVIFYGHEVDVEAATALRWIIAAAMAHDWEGQKYKLSIEKPKANLANEMLSFHMGMGDKLNERMAFVHRAATYAPEGGTSLIVQKSALMEQYFATLGLNLGQSRSGRAFTVSNDSYAAGQAAGARFDNFGTKVGGKTLRIGQ